MPGCLVPAAPVPYVADLHIHSKYSRACSRDLDLPNLAWWARRRGITLRGTGDLSRTAWYDHLREHLVPAEPGLFTLTAPGRPLPPTVAGREVRFMLSVEISTIYKRDDRTRKVHHLVYLPDLDAVARFNAKLARIGNIGSGRPPNLCLASPDPPRVTLAASPAAYPVPAAISTPSLPPLRATTR